jgi:hypothetical protein
MEGTQKMFTQSIDLFASVMAMLLSINAIGELKLEELVDLSQIYARKELHLYICGSIESGMQNLQDAALELEELEPEGKELALDNITSHLESWAQTQNLPRFEGCSSKINRTEYFLEIYRTNAIDDEKRTINWSSRISKKDFKI